jgi:hypothetical protein
MTINDVDTKGQSTTETVISNPIPSLDPNIQLGPIADILKADVGKNSKELGAIKDFLMRDNPKSQMEDLAWGVQEILMRLGTPKFGESNLDRLYQYVFLRTERDNIDNKLNMIGGKHE